MVSSCKFCGTEHDLVPGNKSRKTGEILFRKVCRTCFNKNKTKTRDLEKHSKNSKEWVAKNKEKRAKISKKYRDSNPEKCRQSKQKWILNNLEQSRAWVNARRARVRQATPKWLSKELRKSIVNIYLQAQLEQKTVDHIVPIKHDLVCGLHVPWNLQILSASENFSKQNKWSN